MKELQMEAFKYDIIYAINLELMGIYENLF